MSLPNVVINIERNGLGGVALTVDGIMGLCLTGVAVTNKLVLNTAYALYSLDDAVALGITSAGNPYAYKQIKEFYDEAGTGRKLWIIVSANTMTIADKVDGTLTPCPAKILVESAQGEIKVLGVCWKPGEGTPATPSVRATGTVRITNAGVNGDIARISVTEGTGTPVLLAQYTVAGSPNAAAVAADLKADFLLKKAEGDHAYDATVLTDTITITAPIGLGVSANSFTLSFDSTGSTLVVATVVSFSGGVNLIPGTAYSGTTLDGLDSLVYGAVLKADTLAKNYVSQIMPFSVLLSGFGFTGVASNLRNLTGMTSDRVGIVLAATESNAEAAVGMTLGRLARIPVQRKISRVKDGALPILSGYLSDGAVVDNRTGELGTAHDKGFILVRKFPTRSGYYFNQDTTCAPVSDDLHTISNIRVIDKALVITYNTYVEELDEEVKINADGTLDASMIAYLQATIERNVGMNMVGEISAFEAYIDPKQNILSVPILNVVLRITPVGYMSQIIVSLGFKNPAFTT